MATEIIFEVKKEHLALLKNMSVGWQNCEFGAPEIDPKRPYGNSNVLQDMIEIFGVKEINEELFYFELFGEQFKIIGEDKFNLELEGQDTLIRVLNELHRETETVLQIALQTGMFKEGKYKIKKYGTDWEYIGVTS
jgi:hypothetical protein